MKDDKLHPRITIALTVTFHFTHRMALLGGANMMVICQRIVEDLVHLTEEIIQLESIHSYRGRQEQVAANRHRLYLRQKICVLVAATTLLLHHMAQFQERSNEA